MSKISTIPPEYSDSIHTMVWHDVDMEMPPELEVEGDDGEVVRGSLPVLVSVVDPNTGYRSVEKDLTVDGFWVFNHGDLTHDDTPIVEAWMMLPDTYYNKEKFEKLNPATVSNEGE